LEGQTVSKVSWEMSQEAFDLLLDRLDSDRETAGSKYEAIRLMLMKLFENRNITGSTDHADEVINRLTRKLIEGAEIQSLTAYALGIARLYIKEVLRGHKHVALEDEEWSKRLSVAQPSVDEGESQHERCLTQCLDTLKHDDRELILQYYEEDKEARIDHRKVLADKLGMTTITLRTRACRIRMRLEECTSQCLGRASSAS
jgi:DNA-directed RNA polymerase specialized sigma24 family protein